MKYKTNLRIEGSKVYSYQTHVATIDYAGRRLLVHGWWSVTTSKHVNHVADTFRLVKVDAPRDTKPEAEAESGGMLKSVAMVAAFGNLLCNTEKDKNDWKLRMMKAGLSNQGLSVPEDFDSLPEVEKSKRLNSALAAIS